MTKNQIQVIESVKDQREIEIFDKQRKISIQKLFTPQGMDLMIEEIRKEALAFEGDMTTKKGRAEIRSMAYKVACSKAPLEGLAKELKEEHQAAIDAVNEQVKKFKGKFDELRDEIRKPVDEMEAKEEIRINERKERIEKIESLRNNYLNSGSMVIDEINDSLKKLEELQDFDWQEFDFKAQTSIKEIHEFLLNRLDLAKKAEEERKELEQLRKEKEERDRKDREEQIAKEAEERAKKQAEEEALKAKQEAEAREKRIQEERIAAEADKKAAEERAKEAERLRKEQEAQAEANRIAAEKKAKDDAKKAAEEAVRKEKERAEAQRLAEEAKAAKIAANKKHRKKIEDEAIQDILSQPVRCISEEQTKTIVGLISKGLIRNISINY